MITYLRPSAWNQNVKYALSEEKKQQPNRSVVSIDMLGMQLNISILFVACQSCSLLRLFFSLVLRAMDSWSS